MLWPALAREVEKLSTETVAATLAAALKHRRIRISPLPSSLSPHDSAIAFVYRRILRRDATPSEVAAWAAEMERGLNFGDFVDLVSASDEASTVADDGLDASVAAVGNLVSIVLARRPTAADVAAWTEQLRQGRSMASFIDEILDSPEAMLLAGSTMVAGIYRVPWSAGWAARNR